MGLISRVSSRTYRTIGNLSKMAAAKQIDWSKLGWCMTQSASLGSASSSMFANGGARYAAFKTASDNVLAAHSSANNRAKSIDFESYKKALPNQAAWVDSMEKQFNGFNVPKPKDTLTAGVNADESKVAEAVKAAASALDAAGSEAAADAATLKALPPTPQMTFADVYRAFPELNPYTAEEMEKNLWETVVRQPSDYAELKERMAGYRNETVEENTVVGKP